MKKILLLVGLLVVCIHAAMAGAGPPGCMSPTVVDGYVKDPLGNPVSGANVTVTTPASSCNTWSDLTDANGYYDIPGLLIQGYTVSANAVKVTEIGSNSSYSPNSTLRLNIQVCAPPSAPTLTHQNNTHRTNVTLYWTAPASGFYNESTYTPYRFNAGSWQNKTSPQVQSGLSYTSYTWDVKTCGYCCSPQSSDSFQVTNQQPTAPVLVPVPDSHNTTASLCWTSGNDSDTDPVDTLHDEFYFDDDSDPESGPLQSNISIPVPPTSHCINVSNLSYGTTYYWKVKTCDDTGASNACNYATDSFTVGNSPPSPPVLVHVENITTQSIDLNWTSGVDPDGDGTYDVYEFGVDGSYTTSVSNATAPQTATNLSGFTRYTWRVKTCDIYGACSSWSSDWFIVCLGNVTCPACPTCVGGGGGGGGTGGPGFILQNLSEYCPASYILTFIVPPGTRTGQDFAIQLNVQVSKDVSNAEITVETPDGIRLNKDVIKNIKANKEVKKILVGHIDDTVKTGLYTLRFRLDMDGDVIYKDITLRVSAVGVAICGNGVCETGENTENCFIDCYTPTAMFFATRLGGIFAWLVMLLIALLLILLHLSRKKDREIERYICARLKHGEEFTDIKRKLIDIGYSESRVEKTHERVKKHKHPHKPHTRAPASQGPSGTK